VLDVSIESVAAIVLVAHGSRAAAANDAHRAAAAALADRLGRPVIAAFLELAEPSIGDGIAQAVDAGAAHVVVLPHLLYPGRHLTIDIPGAVAEATTRHPGVEVTILDASGADPAVVDLLAVQVTRVIDGG
jgi:sirohydrochlorin ferrochelatase